jgi:hypothetical protein
MEESIFDALPGFDRLLEQKSFEALTAQEREQVLRYISADDYIRMRDAVLVTQHGTRRSASPVVPDPSVKSRLMQRPGARGNSSLRSVHRSFSRIIGYRIPAYQAALAASVLLFMVIYLLRDNDRIPARIAVADTVYVDRPVLLKDTVMSEKSRGNSTKPAKTGRPHHKTGENNLTRPIAENRLYASQVRDALDRMSLITGLDNDKTVNHDARLMKLVATGPATTILP